MTAAPAVLNVYRGNLQSKAASKSNYMRHPLSMTLQCTVVWLSGLWGALWTPTFCSWRRRGRNLLTEKWRRAFDGGHSTYIWVTLYWSYYGTQKSEQVGGVCYSWWQQLQQRKWAKINIKLKDLLCLIQCPMKGFFLSNNFSEVCCLRCLRQISGMLLFWL